MTNINHEYYVFVCGNSDVSSPYIACSKSHYLIYRDPISIKFHLQAESPSDPDEEDRLIDAMNVDGTPMVSLKIKECLDYFTLYQLQLLPTSYTHADNSEHIYWTAMLNNSLKVYDFKSAKFYNREEDDEVDGINIRLDQDKLLSISLEKRLMFEVYGMRGVYLVHYSIAEPLKMLNAIGIHLVPVLEWDIGFEFTI